MDEINKQISRDISTRASRVRSEKKKISISIQKIREKHESDAKEIRSMSVENEESLKKEKKRECEYKRELVEKAH